MNNVPDNLTAVFAVLFRELQRVYYWGSLPFTLWDIATCGLIVSVMATFLSNIVFFWRHNRFNDYD